MAMNPTDLVETDEEFWRRLCRRYQAITDSYAETVDSLLATCNQWQRTFNVMCVNVVAAFLLGLILGAWR